MKTNKPFVTSSVTFPLKRATNKKLPFFKGRCRFIDRGVLILSFILFFVLFKKINAQSFTSPSYHIDWGNFNMTGGKKSSTNYILTDTVGQNAPGQYNSAGYTVKAGFQYAYDPNYKFSFSIDNLDINFGPLTPNIGTTQTNNLTITTPTGHGYEIFTSQNSSLTTLGINTTIPDTTCDNNDCDQTTSGVWINNNIYGFGFNATGDGTSTYFIDSTYFRQFANQQTGESPQIFMSENNPVKNHTSKITYKINISPLQPEGSYQNNINFTAVPKY